MKRETAEAGASGREAAKRTPLRSLLGRWSAVFWASGLLVGLEAVVLRGGLWYELAAYSPEFRRTANASGGNIGMEQLARNLAAVRRPYASGARSVCFVGSSTTAFSIVPGLLKSRLSDRGVRSDVRVLWIPGSEMTGVYYLTQLMERHQPKVVVLGVSPSLTQRRPNPANSPATQYPWYQDRHSCPPPVGAYGWPLGPSTRGRASRTERLWCLFRWRQPLRHHAWIAGNGVVGPLGVFARTREEPDVWLRGIDVAAFQQARKRYHRSADPEDYLNAYTTYMPALESVFNWRNANRGLVWHEQSEQWATLAAWIHLVRTQGGEPVLAILPYNPFYFQAASGAWLDGGDTEAPFLDPQRYQDWQAKVERLGKEHQVTTWNDFGRFGPGAFYDLCHLMPQARPAYADVWSQRLAEHGDAPPR